MKLNRAAIIAVDFDGTLAEREYPKIGTEVPQAFWWLYRFEREGARIILWTSREGQHLEEALAWCRARHFTPWAVNKNPDQHVWSRSPKLYADVYIDDKAAGCPLIDGPDSDEPMVDWAKIGPEVMKTIQDDTNEMRSGTTANPG